MYVIFTMTTIQIARAASDTGVIGGLQSLLSSTISLTSSTQSAHWSVTGPDFFQLHAAFGSQYEELFESQDVLAERIRALQGFPKAECAGTPVLTPPFSAQEAVTKLLSDREAAIALFKNVAKAARDSGDTVTENMLLSMIEAHQKAAWMLRSYLR